MKKRTNNLFCPDILGMNWFPGDLVFVGGSPGGGRMNYILGNCIVKGTSKNIPVGIFSGGISISRITFEISHMQAEREELPVYIDDTQDITISYLIMRILSLVEHQGIGMVVVYDFQKINCTIIQDFFRERQMGNALRILKTLAVALNLVIVVTSALSDRYEQGDRRPTVADIIDVSEPERIYDQIILLHGHSYMRKQYKLILPKGLSLYDVDRELVINAVQNDDYYYFERACVPFEHETEDDFPEEDDLSEDEDMPIYRWYTKGDGWCFKFLDSDGMGWRLSLRKGEPDHWDITLINQASEERDLQKKYLITDDEGELKKEALRLAGYAVPDVELSEKY